MTNTGWTNDDPIDLDNESTEPPPPLADAIYRLQVTKAEAAASKKGKPCIQLEFNALFPFGGDPSALESVSSQVRFEYLSLEKKALFKLKQFTVAIGVNGPKSTGYEVVSAFCREIVGLEVWAKTKRASNNGRIFAKIDKYLTEAQAQNGGEDPKAPAGSNAEEPATPVRKKRAAAG